jgi:alginate O-acetyltransferase complex protein AlgI
MLFLTYWFAAFSGIFLPTYWIVRNNIARQILLLIFGAIFYVLFDGRAGVIPILLIGLMTYLAGWSDSKTLQMIAIAANVGALVFYKYSAFLARQLIAVFDPQFQGVATDTAFPLLPTAAPFAISFFVFEFVHYLMDVRNGTRPIISPLDFALFSLFWPSVVAGPIKRYEQFLPAIGKGTAEVTLSDTTAGFL